MYYRKECSTIHFQGNAQRKDLEDVSVLSSIRLNSNPNARKRISTEGFQRLQKDPELCILLEVKAQMLDAILSSHGSTQTARCGGDPDFAKYFECEGRHCRREASLLAPEFQNECRAFFADLRIITEASRVV